MSLLQFPNPVNETSARLVAGGVVAMASATIALDQPWILAPLTYGFAARVLAGPTFSPLGLVATRVLTPRLAVEHRFTPGPPKRMAQGIGLVFSATAAILAATGRRRLAYRVLGALWVAASLEAFAGFCLGCKLFAVLMKLGVIPESACEACNDIWSRYPDGHAEAA